MEYIKPEALVITFDVDVITTSPMHDDNFDE